MHTLNTQFEVGVVSTSGNASHILPDFDGGAISASKEVQLLLQDYFDALYFCDVDKLYMVFHPSAIYVTADETPLLYRTMDEYFQVVAARQSPASRNEVRRDVIDAIELAGENTAFARVRCSIGSRDFVDFLTLVCTEGRWQIIAKVFQVIERNPTL